MCWGYPERAKCRTPYLLGYIVYSGLYVDAEAPQERTLDGGAARPLGIKVSWGSSSEEGGAAHGPLHPAVCKSLETLMALLFILLLWSRFCYLLIVSRFLSLGLGSCLVFKPFKPRPVFGFCQCPSFLCLVGFVDAVFSLSLSQALGKSKPIWFGFPLVFSSSCTRSPTSIRTSSSARTPR